MSQRKPLKLLQFSRFASGVYLVVVVDQSVVVALALRVFVVARASNRNSNCDGNNTNNKRSKVAICLPSAIKRSTATSARVAQAPVCCSES